MNQQQPPLITLPAQLTASQAPALLHSLSAQISAWPAQAVGVLDAAAVQQFDSAGLSLLLACRRHAQAQGRSLRLQNCPTALQSLAQVYGVGELLGLEMEMQASEIQAG